MMAQVLWMQDADGFWDTPGNWSTGSVPGAADDVFIDRGAANPVITVRDGTQSVRSIQSAEALALTGGTLIVAQTLQWNDAFTLDGGTLQGGTLTASADSKLIVSSGTLDGVTLNSDLDLSADSAAATVVNGLVLNGTATLGNFAQLNFSGTQTLSGSGEVVFNDADVNALLMLNDEMTLTIGAGITLRRGIELLLRFEYWLQQLLGWSVELHAHQSGDDLGRRRGPDTPSELRHADQPGNA